MAPNSYYHMQRLNGLEAAAIYVQGEEERGQGVPPHWNVYITVDNVDEVVEKAGQNGGAVAVGPMDVFDAGRMAMLQDRQGTFFAVWQPDQHIGARVKLEPGAIAWNEFLTTDKEDAIAFYQAVLGVERGESMPPMDYTLVRAGGTEVWGVMQMTPEMGEFPPHWGVYFGVADVDVSVAQAQSLGGAVTVSAFDIPNIGRIAGLSDPPREPRSSYSREPKQPRIRGRRSRQPWRTTNDHPYRRHAETASRVRFGTPLGLPSGTQRHGGKG